MTPALVAATAHRSGNDGRDPSCTSLYTAWERATQAPVMAAVRVPPSAWITSQSTTKVRSPSRSSRQTERRERPRSRCISAVRPPVRVLSRPVRVWVERGSMPYSAVIQPEPVPRANRGTPSSTVTAQSTAVLPALMRAEPSAYRR